MRSHSNQLLKKTHKIPVVLVKFSFNFIYKSIVIESEVIKLIFLLFFCTYENTKVIFSCFEKTDRFEALGELCKRMKKSRNSYLH
jgi:hypothetical protein